MTDRAEFEYVLMALANRMVPPPWYQQDLSEERGKVVFLLGAGCSRQYGLPSFVELLTYLWEDCLRIPDPPQGLELLRDKLDKFWQAQGPEDRHKMLEYYLGRRVHGGNCPGYLQLAELAKRGHVKAIVNMNFDTLLEDALDQVGVKYQVTPSFGVRDDERLMVYKPHGTISRVFELAHSEKSTRLSRGAGRARNDLILDIANSDLFTDPDEQQSAQELLTGYDIVSIGYSGVDAKIASALRAFPSDKDPRDRKLFVVNSSRPDPRLLLVMAERASQDLLISGEDAAFENFMVHLSSRVIGKDEGESLGSESEQLRSLPNYMTSTERDSLERCRRMALDIRLSLNIAEQSKTSIEDHGYAIFNTCLKLAKEVGICLSPPEKYLLHCAAFLHDLGYYRGYTRQKAGQYPGWTLLRLHGKLTAELLQERFKEDENSLKEITPKSYKQISGGPSFEDLLCGLCAGHTGLVDSVTGLDGEIQVEAARVRIRFSLLVPLFAVAEDLSEGHPFFPSADPVTARRKTSEESSREGTQDTWAIVDPVLDLYLHRERPIEFEIKRRRVIANLSPKGDRDRPATLQWLLAMAAGHIKRFNKVARDEGGWGVELLLDPKLSAFESELTQFENPEGLLAHYEHILKEALAENFSHALERIPAGSIGEATSILDLASIYTMTTHVTERPEPRIPLATPGGGPSILDSAFERAARAMKSEIIPTSPNLLAFYLPLKRRDEGSWNTMERMFIRSFESILYPSSRFFSRNWHDGIESTLMARICFDMGFSRFRWENVDGLRRLLEEKVFRDEEKGHAYGHDKCTICTSRLLYVFTSAKRLIPQYELNRFARGLDQVIASILRYMLNLDADDDIWWGLQPDKDHQGKIRSAEYVAWAARAVTFCLSLDLELRETKTTEDWLGKECGLDRTELAKLLEQRWDRLLRANKADLLSPLAEEPHSFVFGHVALACLDLMRLNGKIPSLAEVGGRERIKKFSETLQEAAADIGTLSQLSEFFLWPRKLLMDSLGDPEAGVKAVNICYKCVESPVWIKTGADAGSWGFNVKNTQTIVTSLLAFWQYVFEGDQERRTKFQNLFNEREASGNKERPAESPRQASRRKK